MMRRRYLGIFIMLLVLLWISPTLRGESSISHVPSNRSPLSSCGKGTNMSDPYLLEVDTYYGNNEWERYFNDYDYRYLSFEAEENEIYYVYADPGLWWDAELFDDPEFSVLLGTLHSVGFDKRLFFSPNRTGTYYMCIYYNIPIGDFTFAVLTPEHYIINSSALVIIGVEYQPIHLFQVDLEAGEYTCTYGADYAKIERGWNYAAFPEAYGSFPEGATFTLEEGTYGIIIEESCTFCLTYYPPRNDTPPDDPGDNSTDSGGFDSIFDDFSPAFIGVAVVGLLLFCCWRKKK